MKFQKDDTVKVIMGGLTGKKGRVSRVVGTDHIQVDLDGMDGVFPFMNKELSLNE